MFVCFAFCIFSNKLDLKQDTRFIVIAHRLIIINIIN